MDIFETRLQKSFLSLTTNHWMLDRDIISQSIYNRLPFYYKRQQQEEQLGLLLTRQWNSILE